MRSSTRPMPKQVWNWRWLTSLILYCLILVCQITMENLAGWLRAESVLDATPIAAVILPEETAKAMVESYGFDGYICKPSREGQCLPCPG